MVNQCKIARFKRHAAQQPLEAQLVGLRQREEEVAQAAPEDTPISTEVHVILVRGCVFICFTSQVLDFDRLILVFLRWRLGE